VSIFIFYNQHTHEVFSASSNSDLLRFCNNLVSAKLEDLNLSTTLDCSTKEGKRNKLIAFVVLRLYEVRIIDLYYWFNVFTKGDDGVYLYQSVN
jgi:hypothetical protein